MTFILNGYLVKAFEGVNFEAMFCAEDDDASPKTPIVHPNDVLDIEVSPIARPFMLPPPPTCEHKAPEADLGRAQRPACSSSSSSSSSSRQKLKKASSRGNGSGGGSSGGGSKKQMPSSMKRGDPFLPSVFSDENPIADFTVRRNSRKKPSDCKCKGFGYNLSPSALLPEEMRQQWGVGVFGKQTAIKPASAVASGLNGSGGGLGNSHSVSIPSPSERESVAYSVSMSNVPRLVYVCNSNGNNNNSSGSSNSSNSSNINTSNIVSNNSGYSNSISNGNTGMYCPLRCMRCMRDQCFCAELGQIHEGFRIPDYSEKRKQRSTSKGLNSKIKDGKSGLPGIMGNTINTTPLKRTACYSSKDNSNIISTSNFTRNNPTPVHVPYSGVMYNSDPTGINSSSPLSKYVSSSKICHTLGDSHLRNKGNAFMQCEHLSLPRHSPHHTLPRRVIANISPAPIISAGSLDVSSTPNFHTPKKAALLRGMAPTRRMLSQECACDSCRRRSNLTMEALGLSTSDSCHVMSPFLFARSQRYQNNRTQSMSMPSRYSPYRLPSYTYKSTLRDVYGSPEGYGRSSSPFYEFGEAAGLGPPVYSSTPLSTSNDISQIDSSSLCLDCDSSAMSPLNAHNSGAWMVDDITDLSIKETVEFFMSMKPPIPTSVPSPQSDTSSDMFPPSPGEHRCSSPTSLASGSSSCFCMGSRPLGVWPGPLASDKSSFAKDQSLEGFDEPVAMKFTSGSEGSSACYPSSSLLYSSLVSDLEDELRCAIENIPTG